MTMSHIVIMLLVFVRLLIYQIRRTVYCRRSGGEMKRRPRQNKRELKKKNMDLVKNKPPCSLYKDKMATVAIHMYTLHQKKQSRVCFIN